MGDSRCGYRYNGYSEQGVIANAYTYNYDTSSGNGLPYFWDGKTK